jgi:hypothetical protein
MIDTLMKERDRTIAQRDEARKQFAAWKEAESAVAMGKLAWFPALPAVQSLPPDEGAIRAVVDALENEHRHVEKIDALNDSTDMVAQRESYGRMKMLAGLLERLVYPLHTT